MGLSVVSQTRCRIEVFPAFALPIIRTRNRIFGIRRWVRSVDIGAMEFGKVVDRCIVDRRRTDHVSFFPPLKSSLVASHYFPAFRPSGGGFQLGSNAQSFPFFFGDLALKPSQNALSPWSLGCCDNTGNTVVSVLFGFPRTRTTGTHAESTSLLYLHRRTDRTSKHRFLHHQHCRTSRCATWW
jgi:hypothetical protein